MKLFTRYIALLLMAVLFCSCGERAENRGIFAPSRLNYVKGQDGVSSIPFDNNTTLWTFADTIIPLDGKEKTAQGSQGDQYTMISNSLAWTEKVTAENVTHIQFSYHKESGKVAQFIKNRRGENPLRHRFWALDGVRIGDRVYVYYAHIYVPDPVKFLEFSVKYIGLAVWDIPADWKPGNGFRFMRIGALFPEGYPFFGAAAMIRDGYLYTAGHSKRDGAGFPLSFARVKTCDIENPGSYEYLDGQGRWTGDFRECAYFFNDVSGECSLSYNSCDRVYDVFYARVFTGETLHVTFRDFSSINSMKSRVIYSPPLPREGGMWAYSAKEIFSEGCRTFLIYIDPDKYQPVLLELER